MEQDKLVTEKDSKVAELSDQVQQMATKLSQLTLDNEKLQSENREAKEKLLEHEKTLETNEKGWGLFYCFIFRSVFFFFLLQFGSKGCQFFFPIIIYIQDFIALMQM